MKEVHVRSKTISCKTDKNIVEYKNFSDPRLNTSFRSDYINAINTNLEFRTGMIGDLPCAQLHIQFVNRATPVYLEFDRKEHCLRVYKALLEKMKSWAIPVTFS